MFPCYMNDRDRCSSVGCPSKRRLDFIERGRASDRLRQSQAYYMGSTKVKSSLLWCFPDRVAEGIAITGIVMDKLNVGLGFCGRLVIITSILSSI
jgi:hypothetical protein